MYIHGGDVYTYQNMLDYSANINPLGIPEHVVQAAQEGVRQSAQYPDVQYRELRQALAEQEHVLPQHIICGNGAADLLFTLVLAIKPKRALLLAPSFYEYEQALRTLDCQIEYYYLRESNGFYMREDFLDQLTGDLDIVYLCNPNNPTGVLAERDFLERVAQKCEENGIYLILDECFNDFLDEPERYTMKAELRKFSRLFLVKAFTKLYAMAGLRLGYGICANSALLNTMREMTQPWNISLPAQKAGIAALQETDYVRRTKELIRTERQFLRRELRARGLQVFDSAANFLFFRGPARLAEYCMAERLIIRDCSNYVGLTQGYFRIAVGTHENNETVIRVLQTCMEKAGGA